MTIVDDRLQMGGAEWGRANAQGSRVRGSGFRGLIAQRQVFNRQLDNPQPPHATDESAKLRQATQEFEAIFIGQLMSQMRKAMAPQSGFLDGGLAEEMWRDVLDQEVAKSVARRGGFGIGAALYRQLARATLSP